MLTEKDYCDYETQKSLMSIGFPMKAQSYDLGKGVKEYLPKIHLYEAQKWLREEKRMLLQPAYLELSDTWICVIRDKNKRHGYSAPTQKDYEEALLEGIKEAVKILKEK
jgi:hypothetical protein